MEVILSISAWFNFIIERLIADAIFVPVAVLAGFAFFNRKEYKNKKILRFISTGLIFSVVYCYLYFVYMNMKINTRYLYPAVFYVIILCVPGFSLIILLLKKLTQKIAWIKEKHLIIFLLLVIAAGSICKALGTPDRKLYIHNAAKIIKASSHPLLISNLRDSSRVAWHSNAELLLLSSVADIDNPVNFESALQKLSSKNKNIFLFVAFKDAEFRKRFSNKKVRFPAQLVLLKEFKAKHKRFYSLYKAGLSDKRLKH